MPLDGGESGGKRALSADAVTCAACAHAFGFLRTTARSCVPRMRIELALCSSSGPRSIQPVPKLQLYCCALGLPLLWSPHCLADAQEKCTGTNDIFFYLFPFSMFPSK
jgi:hypothetical protein